MVRSSSGKNTRNRILLDANIWRYVVDSAAQGDLVKAARQGSHEILIAPAVLYEAMRLKDVAIRGQLISLMTNHAFRRLMPEGFSESSELLSEIRRLRPSWLRAQPDVTFYDRLYRDWARKTGGFWVRCERNPSLEVDRVLAQEGDTLARAADEIRGSRREMIDYGWKALPPMNKVRAALPQPILGWNGGDVEPWRVLSWSGWTYALKRPGGAYRDWIAPFVDVERVLFYTPDWVSFWLHDTQADRLPRQWLRWAHAFAQRFRKVTDGSGADNQLFTYLLETDFVVTADKGFLAILEEVRPFAPVDLPVGILLPAGRQGVDDLMTLLAGASK